MRKKIDPEHSTKHGAEHDTDRETQHELARYAARFRQRLAGRDPDELSAEELAELEAQSDPLIQLVAHFEAMRPDSKAYNDPRFLEWLARERREAREARERRGHGRRSREPLSKEEVTALATRVIGRVQAERLGIHDYRYRPAIDHDCEPLRVSEMVEELRGSARVTVSDLPVAAGVGRELWDQETDSWTMLPAGVPRGAHLVLPVAGDSMEPLFHAGDLVLVKLSPDVKPESVIVALLPDQGYVVKRVGHVAVRSIELQSLNAAYTPIRLRREEHSVLGTVIARWCDHDWRRA